MTEQLKALKQQDYEQLKPYYEKYTSDIHDLNLTNLLIWRAKHDLHHMTFGGYLWFVYQPKNPLAMMFSEPVGDYLDEDSLIDATREWLEFCDRFGLPKRLRHVGEAFKTILSKMSLEFSVFPVEADYDYVYVASELARLSGNKFHKKKNHLNQFMKYFEGRYDIQDINVANANAALTAARNWCIASGCGETLDLCHEYHGIMEILTHWRTYEARGLMGTLVLVDHEPAALTFGELIQNETVLVHIEKADSRFQGAYAMINHAFANRVESICVFINREQDMGIEGIKKAKQSYHPHHLVSKYDCEVF